MRNDKDFDSTDFWVGFIFVFGVVIPSIFWIWACVIKEIISIFK